MNTTEWTKEEPKAEGWYWTQIEDEVHCVEVLFYDDSLVAWETGDEMFFELSDYEWWLGPLTVPCPPEKGETGCDAKRSQDKEFRRK